MSVDVEQKVVEMRFNNAEFEKGVRGTLGTLEKLNESLKFKNASKGIADVNKSVRTVNFSPIATSIQAVSRKVNIQTAAINAAVANLTNTAVNFGKQVTRSLTITPVKTGLDEYEEKMNSIKVIMTNTKRHGTTFDQVAAALDDLNLYADKTIYNFQQMTSAIGQFTTQGVPLQRSVNAVKGVANLAAYVGAPASDASRAMFQLSQALSTGTVRLQDWMSLEHTAGMGGKEFQTRLIETARVLGTNVDKSIKKAGNFRESLKDGWLTTEVLTNTLAQFAGEVDKATLLQQGFTKAQADNIIELGKSATSSATLVRTISQLTDTMKESVQSGWAKSWEYIVGDLDDASDLLTGISKTFDQITGQSADARNEMLKIWNLGNGRDAVIEGMKYILKGLGPILIEVGDAINEVFPPATGKSLLKGSKAFYDMSKNVHLSKKALKGLLNVLKITTIPFKTLRKLIEVAVGTGFELVGMAGKLLNSLLELASGLDEVNNPFTAFIDEADRARMLEAVTKIVEGLSDGFENLSTKFRNLTGSIKYLSIFNTLTRGIGISSAYTFHLVVLLLEAIASFTPEKGLDALRKVANAVKTILKVASEVPIVSFFLEKLQNGGIKVLKIYENIGTNMLQLASAVGKFTSAIIKNGPGRILESWSDFNEQTNSIFGKNSFLSLLTKMVGTIPKVLSGLINAITKTPLAQAFIFLANIIKKPVDSIKQMITELINGVVDAISKLNLGSVMVMSFSITMMKAITTISKAIENFSQLTKDLSGMVGSLKTLFSTAGKELQLTAKTYRNSLKAKIILKFAIAIGILTASLAVLTALDMDKLKTSAIVLAGVVTVMSVALMALSNASDSKTVLSVGASISMMAASMMAVAFAFRSLEGMRLDDILKSILTMSAVIAAFVGVTLLISRTNSSLNRRNMLSFAAVMASFGVMVAIVTKTMTKINDLSIPTIIKSFAVFASLIGMLRLIGSSMDNIQFTGAVGLTVMLFAITKMVPTLAKLGEDLSVLGNALKASVLLAAILRILSIGFRNIGKDLALSGAGFLGLSAAVAVLSFAAKSFGRLSTKEFSQGLSAIKIATMCFLALVAIANLTGGAGDNFGKIGVSLLGMAMATAVLAVAAKQFASMDPKDLIKVGAILYEIMSLYALITVASHMATGSSRAINALSRNLLILMMSLGVLTLIEPEQLLRASAAMSMALLGLAAVLAGAGRISNRDSVKTVTVLSVVIGALTGLMVYVSKLPNPQKFLAVATGMSELLLALSISLRILGKDFKIDNGVILQLSMLSLVVLGLYSLMNMMNVTSKGKVNFSYITAIGLMLTIVSANLRILEGMKGVKKRVLGNVAVLSAIISGLFAVVSVLNRFKGSTKSAIKNAFAAGILLTAVSQSMRILQNIRSLNKGVLGNVAVLSAIISGLMIVVSIFGKDNSFESAISTALSVSILLTAISGSMLILETIVKVSKDALAGVAVLTGVVLALSYSLSLLNKIQPAQAIASSIAISALLLTLVGSTGILMIIGQIGSFKSLISLLGAGGMLGITYGLSLILKSLSDMNPATAISVASALSDLMLKLTAVTVLIQLANPIGALGGVIAMGEVIIAMGVVLAALGELDKNLGAKDILQRGSDTLAVIGEGIGKFFGSIAGGFVEGAVQTALPAIGTALTNFAENASGFFSTVQSLDQTTISGVNTLVNVISTLTSLQIKKGLADTLTGVIDLFTGGLAGKVSGDQMTLKSFAKQLAEAAPDFKTFASEMAGIENFQNVDAGASVIRAMVKIQDELPREGGWWQSVTGTKEHLGEFVNEFPIIASNLRIFVAKLQLIPNDSDTQALTDRFIGVMDSMVRIADALPRNYGLWQGVVGTKKELASFVGEFSKIANGLGDYVSSLEKYRPKGVDVNALVTDYTSVLWSLVRIQEALSGSNGVIQWWSGNKDLAGFGTSIGNLGKALATFIDNVKDINADQGISALGVVESLSNIAKNAPASGEMFNILDSDFENFIQNLGELGEGIADFYEASKAVNSGLILNVAEGLNAIAEVCKNVQGMDGDSVENFSTALGALASASISSFTTPFANSGEAVRNSVGLFIGYVKSSIDAQKPELEEKFKSVAHMAVSAMEKEYKTIVNSGNGFGDQIVKELGKKKTENGISNKTIKMFSNAFSSLTGSFKKVTKKLTTLVKSLDVMSPKLTKISKALSETSEEAKKADKKINKVGKTTKDTGNKIKNTTTNIKKGSKALDDLSKSSKKAEKSTKKAGTASEKAGKKAKKLAKSTDEVSKADNTATKENNKLKKGLEKTKEVADKAKEGIDGLTSSLGDDSDTGFGLGNALKNIGKIFSDLNPLENLKINFNPEDIEKKTDEKLKEVEDDFNKNTKKSTKKTRNIVKEFKDNLRSTLQGIVSPFEEFSGKKAKISIKKMISNLNGQYLEISKWSRNISKLSENNSGIGKSLLKYLVDMGPTGTNYVTTIAKASKKTRKRLNSIYENTLTLTNRTTNKITKSFGKAGLKAIESFRKNATSSEKFSKKTIRSALTLAKEYTYAYQKAYFSEQDKLEKKIDKNNSKMLEKRLNSGKKLNKNQKKIMASYEKYTVNGMTTVEKKLDIGQGALDAFVSAYTSKASKMKDFKKSVDYGSKAVSTYTKELYKNSQYYTDDKKESDKNEKAYQKALKRQKKAEKNYKNAVKRYKKNRTKENLERVMDTKETLKSEVSITKKARKAIEKSADQMAKHMKEVYKELRDGIKSTIESYLDATNLDFDLGIDLFADLDKSKISSAKLLNNITKQLSGASEWAENIAELSSKGLSKGLISYIENLGTAGSMYAKTFAKMTDEEIARANALWEENERQNNENLIRKNKKRVEEALEWSQGLQKMASLGFSKELISALGEMGPDSLDQVQAYLSMTADQVAEFNKSYTKGLKISDQVADEVIASYAYAGSKSMKGFAKALNNTDVNVKAFRKISNQATNTMKNGLKTAANTGVDSLSTTLTSKTNVDKTNNAGKKVGKQIGSGIVSGINSKGQAVKDAAASVSAGAIKASRNTLDIHSPSGEFEKIGALSDDGMAKGFLNNAKTVKDSVVEAMRGALDKAKDVMEQSDTDPVIRPIIDLSNIQNGVKDIGLIFANGTFGASVQANRVMYGTSKSQSPTDALLRSIRDLKTAMENSDSENVTINNEFNITESGDPRKTAQEVDRQLGKMVRRREAVWE